MQYEILRNSESGEWNKILSRLPGSHLLQTWEWGELKEEFGWSKIPIVWRDLNAEICAAAMVLKRSVKTKVPGVGLKVLYVPRGPAFDWENRELRETVLSDLMALARTEEAIFIKFDGEIITGTGEPETPEWIPNANSPAIIEWLKKHDWVWSDEQIQFANTVWINLEGSEEEILARMKQKTRYNIRLAQKKDVEVRRGTPDDFWNIYQMYAETSVRDGFVIRSWDYYEKVWKKFYEAGMMEPLLAKVEGTLTAGLMLFHFAGRALYLYGMSTQNHREKMPNYLLQWEAIRLAKEKGCSIYDLWGAPTHFNDDDSLWQVYRFKEGFAGKVINTTGAWDFPVSRWKYTLYIKILPKILAIMRRRGKNQTKQEAGL